MCTFRRRRSCGSSLRGPRNHRRETRCRCSASRCSNAEPMQRSRRCSTRRMPLVVAAFHVPEGDRYQARLGISSRPDDRSRYRSRHRAPTRSCWSRSAPAPDARTRSCGSTRCRAGNARRAPPSQPVISQLTHRPVNWGTSPQRNEIAASPGVIASRRHATALLAPGLSVYRQCAMTPFS